MAITFVGVETYDLRFPTSRTLAGADASPRAALGGDQRMISCAKQPANTAPGVFPFWSNRNSGMIKGRIAI